MASRDELQHLVDEISALLDAPATLESPDFDLIAFRAHDTDAASLDSVRMRSILGRGSTTETRVWFESFGIASATGPVRTPAEPSLGILTRLCIPVRRGDVLLGYVWLLDDGRIPIDPVGPELAKAIGLTERIGTVLLAHEEAADDLGDVLATALTARGAARADALRVLGEHLGESAAVVVVGGDPAATVSGVVGAVVDGLAVSLVPLADISDDRPAQRIAPAGGIGAPFEEISGLAEGYRQARFAHRVGAGTLRRWDDLGFYRLLIDVRPSDPAVVGLIEALVVVPDLLETAEVFLDAAGNVQAAAAQLHIHRQTLYYRLTRIESLTGLDLSSGTDRLLLHLAVKLAHLGSR